MKNELNQYYSKYKPYLVPTIFLILSLFIIIGIIFPQISSISQLQKDVTDKTDDISTAETSLATISRQNEDDLSDQLELATRALPTSKNIATIFDALSGAATASGADLREFTLKVGGLYGKADRPVVGPATPSVTVQIRVSGTSADSVVEFVKEIRERLPLSDLKTITSSGSFATIDMVFFYKPLNLSAIAAQNKVMPLSQIDKKLLEDLRKWDK